MLDRDSIFLGTMSKSFYDTRSSNNNKLKEGEDKKMKATTFSVASRVISWKMH
jgi:hypothetical protein